VIADSIFEIAEGMHCGNMFPSFQRMAFWQSQECPVSEEGVFEPRAFELLLPKMHNLKFYGCAMIRILALCVFCEMENCCMRDLRLLTLQVG
jgi:hypothetical protein